MEFPALPRRRLNPKKRRTLIGQRLLDTVTSPGVGGAGGAASSNYSEAATPDSRLVKLTVRRLIGAVGERLRLDSVAVNQSWRFEFGAKLANRMADRNRAANQLFRCPSLRTRWSLEVK